MLASRTFLVLTAAMTLCALALFAVVVTVVPLLEAPATSFQHSHIVSEQGTATVWGCDQRAQARQLVEQVAHPSVRDALREASAGLGLPLS